MEEIPIDIQLKNEIESLENRLRCYHEGKYGRSVLKMHVELKKVEQIKDLLEQRQESDHVDTIAIPFDSEADAINWVWENMPMAVKPTNRSKKHWIHPYRSKHCRRQIANHIGEKLYDQSRSKLKLKH